MYIADNWGNENLWYQAECKEWNCKENKGRAKERKIIEGDLWKICIEQRAWDEEPTHKNKMVVTK